MIMKLQNTLLTGSVVQVFLYGAVGLATFAIDVGSTSVLYDVFHLPAYLASGCGFLLGFLFSFPMNRKKVFRHTGRDRFSLQTQVFMYATLSIFNLVSTSFIVHEVVSMNILNIQYAKIGVTAVIAVWNFLLFKFLIFSKVDLQDPE